jgi:peptidyl-prolyl cis-trans isomerase D
MLDLMRKKAGTWVVKFILGAIIIVFTFWGVGSWTAQKGNRVATVDGEPVLVETYRQAYTRLMDQLRQQFGNNLSEDLLKMLNVDQQALDQVIDQKLLLNEARRLDFNVSNQELVASIASYPGFQVDGAFNRRRYEVILGNNRMTPESFEAMQERSILVDKVRRFVTGNAKVSDLEIREWYNWRNSSVNVEFALFSPAKYKAEGLDDKQAQAFFNENKENYKTDPMAKAEYVFFDPASYTQDVIVTQEDILEYYDSHTSEFNVPKTVQARHVLIKAGQDASADEIEKARVRAVKVVRLARGGEDFARLAGQYSEGPSSQNGGDLGFFKKDDMVKPFSDKAFSMQAGDISDPVRTRFGWHVIKVENIKAPSIKTPDQVDEQIRKRLIDSSTKTFAYNLADSIYEASYEENSFTKSAGSKGLAVVTTDFFDRTGPQKGVVNGTVFAEAAFKLAENEISDIVDAGNGFYLIKIIKKKPASIPDMASVRDQVYKDWGRREKEKMAMNAAGAFLEFMREKADDWVPTAEKAAAETGETGYFKKTEAIPQIGRSNQIARIAFELSKEKPLPDAPVKGEKGIYVVRFKGRKLPDNAGFDKEKNAIKTSLLGQKQRDIFSALVSTLRSNSEIVIEDRYKN